MHYLFAWSVSSAFLFNRRVAAWLKPSHQLYHFASYSSWGKIRFLNPRQRSSFFPRKLAHREHTSHRHHLYQTQQKSYLDPPTKPDKPCDAVCNQEAISKCKNTNWSILMISADWSSIWISCNFFLINIVGSDEGPLAWLSFLSPHKVLAIKGDLSKANFLLLNCGIRGSVFYLMTCPASSRQILE